jgi:hypothetical protein
VTFTQTENLRTRATSGRPVRRHCRLTCSTVGIEDIEGVFQEAKTDRRISLNKESPACCGASFHAKGSGCATAEVWAPGPLALACWPAVSSAPWAAPSAAHSR